jgi:ABC-2 type transport system permease protein
MTTDRSTIARPTTQQRVTSTGAAGWLRGVYIIWYRDILRFWRDRARIAASLAQPLLFLIVFGTGLGSALGGAGSAFGGASYVQFVFPGIVGMAILFSSIFGAMSILWDREFGFLKEVLVAPIDRSAVAVGKALGGATQAMIQGLILLVLAPLVGVSLTFESVFLLLVFLFVLAFALSSLGVAIGSRMRSIQGFQVVMNFLMMPMFFLSGALFPLSGLPDWLAVLTRLDLATYGIDPLRRIVLAPQLPPGATDQIGLTIFGQVLPIALEALVLIGFGFVMLRVAVVNFRRRD